MGSPVLPARCPVRRPGEPPVSPRALELHAAALSSPRGHKDCAPGRGGTPAPGRARPRPHHADPRTRPAPTRLCGVPAPGRGAQRAVGPSFPAARPGAGVSSLMRHGGSSRGAPGGEQAGGRREGTAGSAGTRADSGAARACSSRGVQSSGGKAAELLRSAHGMRQGRSEGDLGPLGSPGGGRGLGAAACCKLGSAEAK